MDHRHYHCSLGHLNSSDSLLQAHPLTSQLDNTNFAIVFLSFMSIQMYVFEMVSVPMICCHLEEWIMFLLICCMATNMSISL